MKETAAQRCTGNIFEVAVSDLCMLVVQKGCSALPLQSLDMHVVTGERQPEERCDNMVLDNVGEWRQPSWRPISWFLVCVTFGLGLSTTLKKIGVAQVSEHMRCVSRMHVCVHVAPRLKRTPSKYLNNRQTERHSPKHPLSGIVLLCEAPCHGDVANAFGGLSRLGLFGAHRSRCKAHGVLSVTLRLPTNFAKRVLVKAEVDIPCADT